MNDISPLAVVQSDALGENVTIMEFAVVRAGARIGNNVVIHPHVVIASGVEIGDGVEVFPGAFLGKEPKGAGALARTPQFARRLVVGNDCSIGPHAILYYDVEIGANTLIGDGASIRELCRIGSRCIISRYVTINYDTVIGDRTKVMDMTHVTGKCRIGNDVFISLNVGMANDRSAGKHGYNEDAILGPIIEDDAIIGAGATLLPGVHIGAGATVASGALINKDVEAGTVVAGSPARLVRRASEDNSGASE